MSEGVELTGATTFSSLKGIQMEGFLTLRGSNSVSRYDK